MNSTGRYIVALCIGFSAALLGWSVLELILSLQHLFPGYTLLLICSGGLSTAAMTAVIASMEGILHKNTSKLYREWGMGILWGLAGGTIGALAGQFLFGILLPETLMPDSFRNSYLTARIISWAIMGFFIGTAEGFRIRSLQKIQAGMAAGLIGGALGGAIVEGAMIFYPSDSWLKLPGFLIMTLGTSLLTNLIETVSAPGVFRVLTGASKGRKYLINQKKTRVGSHGGCDISIKGNDSIPPFAVNLKRRGKELLIEGIGDFKVSVNDDFIPAGKDQILKYDDVIKVGDCKFLYEVRQ
ncbi:MAG: FHA domain-containing protein [Spirochaetales bacterium]|nr:FHA domain-containing protein [Spirochaetales bacterium]